MSNVFDGLVGQDNARRQLSYYLENHELTGVFPNMIFVAPRGTGKTELARRVSRGLALKHTGKRLIEISSSSVRSVGKFFDTIVGPFLVGQPGTVFFDEASDLVQNLETALLTILQPDEAGLSEYVYNGARYTFNTREHTFLFATTKPQKVNSDLLDRLERIALEEYTIEQLGRIVLKRLKNVDIEQPLLDEIASVLRANARQAVRMSERIRMYLTNESMSEFKERDWKKLKRTLNIMPLGLNQTEVTVMRYLAQRELTTLTMLSSKLGMIRDAVQRDVESYLLKLDLIEIQPKGRALTQKGRDYLKALDE